MSIVFDDISLSYWKNNYIKLKNKSYQCLHNGYIYGDQMTYSKIQFLYIDNGKEIVIHEGTKNSKKEFKECYYCLVKFACQKSQATLQNFLNEDTAQKYRIYTEKEVNDFTESQVSSTRIKDDTSKIIVNGNNYYVANNLKKCEYIHSASINIDQNDLDNYIIRIYFSASQTDNVVSKDEAEELNIQNIANNINVNLVTDSVNTNSNKKTKASTSRNIKVDYQDLNKKKKIYGDLGELIVLNYEKDKLNSLGLYNLSKKVEHTSLIKGDKYGYDIQSFNEDGEEIFIEVKTTKQKKEMDFFLSQNELEVANEMNNQNKKYYVYRIYNLNPVTGNCDLKIYEPPFNDERFNLKPTSWLVKQK